jgi:ABC-2 type transport system permease protein
MIFNTIYQRERRVGSRSCRMPVVIALFNTAMAVMVLTSMAFTVESARETSIIDYDAFLRIFIVMGMAQFTFMMVMAPAFSSGVISNESERKTLDMMLTTKLSAADIVIGKLMWSLSSAMLVVVSSLPILAILFAYGYVRIHNLAIFLLATLLMELYVGSMSIWASAASRRTSVATAIAYGALLVLTCGTPLLCAAVSNITGVQGSVEAVLYFNPIVPFVAFLGHVERSGESVARICRLLGFSEDADMNTAAVRAVAVQLALSAAYIGMAVRSISPEHRK